MKEPKVWGVSTLAGLIAFACVSNAHAAAAVTSLADASSASADNMVDTLLGSSRGITVAGLAGFGPLRSRRRDAGR